MIRKEIIRIFLAIIFSVGKMTGTLDDSSNLQREKPLRNEYYLGSEASKAYHFPWLVSIHREQETCGSGSIVSPIYVLASMDTFARRSKVDDRQFLLDVGQLVVYSGGIWVAPYLKDPTVRPDWFQTRRVKDIWFWSDPDSSKAVEKVVYKDHLPDGYKDLKASPFGLSMSIALIEIIKDPVSPTDATDHWIWKRITLPIPLFTNTAKELKIKLDDEINNLEKSFWSKDCTIGGWRLGDGRLVQHHVVYVPFDQCALMYCAYKYRACGQWPVKGVHVCFKSVAFTDLCWPDQGSALFCREIFGSVIAILTSAPTCGVYGLPAVFTLINHGMSLFEAVADDSELYTPIPEAELSMYTPPKEENLFPVYR